MIKIMAEINTKCPHCDQEMSRWRSPQDSTWTAEFQYVCFNDECPYFLKGWEWMKSQFNQTASYRHRMNPENGETGPLPVWSYDALKSNIID